MTIKQCDICCNYFKELIELKDEFKVASVAEVCENCLKEINDVLFKAAKAQKIQRMNWIRRLILKMHQET